MGATIQRDSHGIWVVRISGALHKEELDAVHAEGIKGLSPQSPASVLVMVEPDFSGWVGSEVWNDMTFFVKHGDSIKRIAIVGEPQWESRMLMFTGAGFRRAEVKFFTREKAPQAYEWLE